MTASVAYPVQVLREHITGLEAAITLCLADSGGKPVHKLRTETRRVEALLGLIALTPGLPEHQEHAATLLRALTRLRRAAGHVRDLDVQRRVLEDLGDREDSHKEEPAPPSPAAAIAGNGKSGKSGASVLEGAAAKLRDRMGEKRERAVAALRHLLQHRQAKTAKAAEALMKALEPAAMLALPAGDLLRAGEAVLHRDGLLRGDALRKLGEEDLHTIRKAAKSARYIAESLPDDPAVAEAARRFEALQDAGGQWHDALQLTRAARRRFGKDHPLTLFFREDRDRKLASYRAVLRTESRSRKPGRSAPASRSRTPASARRVAGTAHGRSRKRLLAT